MIYFAEESLLRELLVLPAVFIFLLIVWMYLKFRAKQPHLLIPELPEKIPSDDFTDLTGEEKESAKYFWDFMKTFAEDFERTGHPVQYRQFIDLLRYAPSASLKIFACKNLGKSKHLRKYTLDKVLRDEIIESVLENLSSEKIVADAYVKLLLKLPLRVEEINDIITNIQKSPEISGVSADLTAKLINLRDSAI